MTIFCALKVRFGNEKVAIQCAANRIMLHSCDVENCEDTSATMLKEKPRRKDGLIAWPERQMMLATRMIHICRYFYTILSNKSSCMAKMDAF